MPPIPHVFSVEGSYLGGHPAKVQPVEKATLVIDNDGIRVKGFRKFFDVPWENITGLTAERAGGLASLIVVEGSFGEFTFRVQDRSPDVLQTTAFAPFMSLIRSEERPTPEATPAALRTGTLAFSGSYLGGHPARDRPEKTATLVIDGEGIRVSVFRRFHLLRQVAHFLGGQEDLLLARRPRQINIHAGVHPH
jgi:hypothetical protein